MEDKIRKAIKEELKKLHETDYADRLANSGTDSEGRNTWGDKTGYSDKEMAQGKGKLKKYPDKDGRNVWGDKTDYSDEEKAKLKKANEDYKPSHRAYNVIDKSNNDKIVAKELSRDKALELAKTNKDYMISATDRLAEEGMSPEEWADAKEADRLAQHPEKDTINKIKQMMDKEKDEEQEEYDKGWYGESLREAASKLGYLKEVDGMEGGNMSVSRDNKFDHSKFDFQEKVIKAEFMYTEQGGRFYSLTLSTSDNRQIKLKHNEANAWLKDTLEYIHEDDLIPRKYISGLEDLDLIVDRLKELGIEASHNDFMDVS